MSVKSFKQVGTIADNSEVARNTASASNLQELIQTIPRAYQAVLGDHLTKKFRITQKHANVQSTVSAYERHVNEGSLPPIIRNSVKEPRLQFAKEFLGTQRGTKAPADFTREVQQAQLAVLKSALLQKKAELNHLASLIRPDEDEWLRLVAEAVTKVARHCGGKLVPVPGGTPRLENAPASAVSEFQAMMGGCTLYTYRVSALAHAAMDRAELQKISKLKIKESTDVEMTDVSKEPPVRDIVREELQALRRKLSRANGNQQKSNGRVNKKKSPPRKAKSGGGNGKKGRKNSR